MVVLVAVVAVMSLTRTQPVARGTGPAQAARPSATTPRSASPTNASPTAGRTDPSTGLVWVAESALPPQARDTLVAIRAGGPFRYPRNDGVTYGNRERLLPARASGYYKEYTVVTPGSPDRGPRRIVSGHAGELFYTGDHYASFARIRVGA